MPNREAQPHKKRWILHLRLVLPDRGILGGIHDLGSRKEVGLCSLVARALL